MTEPLTDQQLAAIEFGRAAVRAKFSGGAFPAALGQAIADELADAAMAPLLAETTHRLKVANRSHLATLAGCCVMLGLPKDTAEPDVFEAIRRLRAELEQAREQVARDIETIADAAGKSLIPPPRVERGGFMNDWQWAAAIARTPQRTAPACSCAAETVHQAGCDAARPV